MTESAISYIQNPPLGMAQIRYLLATIKDEGKIIYYLKNLDHNSVAKSANKKSLP